MTFTHALATNNYGPAKFIVDSNAANGTHTTLASAMAAAISGDTIFMRSSVTEDVTITPGVNITTYTGAGQTPEVTITGKITMSGSGTSTISNVRLQTNSDFAVVVSGSVASILNLSNCYLNATNNTILSFTTSSASGQLYLLNCRGDIGTTGISLFASSSAGMLTIRNTEINNTGGSTTASTISAGVLATAYSILEFPITTSGTSAMTDEYSIFLAINVTALTLNGSGSHFLTKSICNTGTASSISIGGTVTCSDLSINSTNTNPITGAGTLIYTSIDMLGTGKLINTTSLTKRALQGNLFGITTGTDPATGFVGELVQATVTVGSPVNLPDNTATNVTSISLTAGIWNVTGIVGIQSVTTGTYFNGSITTTSATQGTSGDNMVQMTNTSNTNNHQSLSIAPVRISVSSTTTVFLVAFARYTVGTGTTFGRISATRVA